MPPFATFPLAALLCAAPMLAHAAVIVELHPCANALFGNATCNVKKYIPALDEEMPAGWLLSSSLRPDAGNPDLHWHNQGFACCAISDAYRFIYVKVAKTASSTILVGYLRPTLCPVEKGAPPMAGFFKEKHARYNSNCSATRFLPLESDCFPCIHIPRWKWLHYFVFTSVRNPIDRAISSYLYCKGEAPFSKWCVNPDVGPGGFCREGPGPNIHWGHQYPYMCTSGGQCIVDFVLRMENLEEDLNLITASINAVRDKHEPPLPPFVQALSLNHKGTDRSILQLPGNSHCKRALQLWYEEDFTLLGYPFA